MPGLNQFHHARWLHWTAALTLCLVCGSVTPAAENPEVFLEALHERGYFDVALDYLERLSADPSVSPEFKQRIPYEEGTTLIKASEFERDVNKRVKYLDAARDKLTQFVQTSTDPELQAAAESDLGRVLVGRAKLLLQKAKQQKVPAQKDALTEEARTLFTQAQQVFSSAEQKFADSFKAAQGGDKSIGGEGKQEARLVLRRARLAAAQAIYEAAQAHPADAPERKKLLESAATKFHELHEKWRTILIGLLARTYEGRCYLDLGETRRALSVFEDVLSQPDDPHGPDDLRRIKLLTLSLAMQAWTSDTEKNYEKAAQKGLDVVAKPGRTTDLRSPDGLAIRYLTALALEKHAASLGDKDAGRKQQLLAEARKQAKAVGAVVGDYQDAAKQLVQQLAASDSANEKLPTTFADAFERGKNSLDLMQAKLSQPGSEPPAEAGGDAASREREADEARDKARDLFRLALSLRDAATSIDDVNNARYFLAYLEYSAGNYWDATVLGEFLTTNYPTGPNSRNAARIALSSHLKNYNAAAPADRDDEKQRMIAFADFLTRRFAGEAEADEGWMTLMVIATGERKSDEVLGYLAKIPEASPRRAEAELKAGQALWVAALTAGREPEERRPPPEDIAKLRTQARDLLVQGVDRIVKSSDVAEVNFTMAAAALSLAQIYVETNQAADAVKLLEDLRIGPLALVETKSPLVSEGTFAIEAYKAALRAYVATQQLEKAEKVMGALEARVMASGAAGASQMLVGIYRALGQELENQVASLKVERKAEDMAAVSRGFELFLDRIVAKQEGNNFNSLNWVADTYSRLGSGHESTDGSTDAQARTYFEKAAATDQKILHEIAAHADFAGPDAALAVKLRLAKSQHRAGHYKEAIDLLSEVAAKMPMLLDAQKEAAYTYQDWGRENPATYALAIGGGRKTKGSSGKEFNLLWGWAQLAKLTQRDKKHQDVFHEARYNLAKCYLLLGKTQNGSEKTDSLKKAEAAIMLTRQLHPDLGGGDWPKKYDRLLRQIQQDLGQPETGLPEAKPSEAGTTAAVAK